ncbi:MAG: hypothetical protein PHV32_05075 [Eubacteriales bacterium]|nr:hypothetical protein [Eubacteriales bacterium]
MLKVLLNYGDKAAVFDLPHNFLEVSNYLLTVGTLTPYTDLCLNDDDDPEQVQVKMIAETADDNHLQSLFPKDARLSAVNTVCDLFYSLPVEQQADLIDGTSAGKITSEKDLLDAIKAIKSAEAYAPAIIFSRVRLWTDTGEDCEFFMGGAPTSYDDLEDNEDCIDFGEFVEQLSTGHSKGITAHVTTFLEGDGEPRPASPEDIERIYNAIADVDIDTITGWIWRGENTFTFDYDIDELFHMNGIE